MNASAQAHAAPVHAGSPGGPAASGSSLAENSPKATRERTPYPIEFVQSVRREGLLHGNPRRMGQSRQTTLWTIRDGNEAGPSLIGPVGEGNGVHDQGLGQPELRATGARPETGTTAGDLEGILPTGGTRPDHRYEAPRSGDMGILGGTARCDALSIRPQECKMLSDGHLRPCELARLLNSTPLGEVLSTRQLHRQRERAEHRFAADRRINLIAYVAWLVCERHASPARLDRAGRQRAVCTRDLLNLLNAQSYRCALSGRVLEPANAAMDHVQPVSRGGRHSIENIQLLEKAVNRAKGTMTNDEFLAMCRDVVAWADNRSAGAE